MDHIHTTADHRNLSGLATELVPDAIFGVRAWNAYSGLSSLLGAYSHTWTRGVNQAECSLARSCYTRLQVNWSDFMSAVTRANSLHVARYYDELQDGMMRRSNSSLSIYSEDIINQVVSSLIEKNARIINANGIPVYVAGVELDTIKHERIQDLRDSLAHHNFAVSPKSIDVYFNTGEIDVGWRLPMYSCAGVEPGCVCGFYAYTGKDAIGSVIPYSTGENHLVGVIRGTGKTTIGTRGFRTEKAEILALGQADSMSSSIPCADVSEKYGVPVLRSISDLSAWARDNIPDREELSGLYDAYFPIKE